MIEANKASLFILLSTIQLANAWTNKPDPRIHPKMLQSTAGLTHDICTRAIDRLLLDNIDYNDVLVANSGDWTDSTFPFPDAIFWDDMRVAPIDDETNKEHEA